MVETVGGVGREVCGLVGSCACEEGDDCDDCPVV